MHMIKWIQLYTTKWINLHRIQSIKLLTIKGPKVATSLCQTSTHRRFRHWSVIADDHQSPAGWWRPLKVRTSSPNDQRCRVSRSGPNQRLARAVSGECLRYAVVRTISEVYRANPKCLFKRVVCIEDFHGNAGDKGFI